MILTLTNNSCFLNIIAMFAPKNFTNKSKLTAILTTSILIIGSALTSQAQDLEKGKTLYATCVACHGAEGHGNQALRAPSIAGLSSVYVQTQINNFRNGIRGAHAQDTAGLMMRPMAMQLADDQAVADVSAYVATLKSATPVVTLEGGAAAAGQASYMVCLACHGAKAEGNEALKSPALAHLNDWYLKLQLENFKNKVRGANPKDSGGIQMAPMANMLADEQAILNVIAYIRSISSTE